MKWGLLPAYVGEYVTMLRKPSNDGRKSLLQPGSPSSLMGGDDKTQPSQPLRTMHSLDDPRTQPAEGNESPLNSVVLLPMPIYGVRPRESYIRDRGSHLSSLRNPDRMLVDTPRPVVHYSTGSLDLTSRLVGSATPADDDKIPVSRTSRSNDFNNDENIGL